LYIDSNISEELPVSIFTVQVISPIKKEAVVTIKKAQRRYILYLILWPEFPFASLAQNGVQNFVRQHWDIKFRTFNTYAKNIRLTPVHQDKRYFERCENEHE
jgi:protoheme ferro-lyase